MLSVRHLNELLNSFMQACDEDHLIEALERVTRTLGFCQFAMGHHVDLGQPPSDAIGLSTYNAEWVDHIMERQYFFDDPVHMASMKTVVGFRWSDIPNIIRLSPRQKQILAEAVAFGLGEGFTVPIHLPGEYQGTCSFGAPSIDKLHENALPIAQLCGTFAFEAARRIMRRKSKVELAPPPVLTPRQHEAMILMGRGKTDAEIGQLMQVSRATAHEHVEGARRAYGNAQRVYLIVRALFDGQISFSDLMRR